MVTGGVPYASSRSDACVGGLGAPGRPAVSLVGPGIGLERLEVEIKGPSTVTR